MPNTDQSPQQTHRLVHAILITGTCLLLALQTSAQTTTSATISPKPEEWCGFQDIHQRAQQDSLAWLQAQEILQEIRQRTAYYEQQLLTRDALPIIEIPVVVHVVYENSAENLPDNVIQAMIDTLNKDFRAQRPEILNDILPMFRHLVQDAYIQFCLATVDPNGNPTTGITRTQTTKTCFSTDDAIKQSAQGGQDPWPTNRYLNIWIGDLCGGLLGYATPPSYTNMIQGAVVDYVLMNNALGFMGRTLTHEIGHWLNLWHIWGNQPNSCAADDEVSDTPPCADPNYNCQNSPMPECGYPSRMFQNYMDYSRDECLFLFTRGQVARMRAALETYSNRRILQLSQGCSTPAGTDLAIVDINIERQMCSNALFIAFLVQNKGTQTVSSFDAEVLVDGSVQISSTINYTLAPGDTVTIVSTSPLILQEGTHLVEFRVRVNGDAVSANNTMSQTVLTPISCNYSEDFETHGVPSLYIHIENPDNMGTWSYFYDQTITGANGTLTRAAVFPGYDYDQTGELDYLYLPYIHLYGATSATLSFDVAYAPYQNNSTHEELAVEVTTDCGNTWTEVYRKSGTTLATANATTNLFIPSSASQWRRETVDLSAFVGQTIRIRFRARNAYGNHIYLDNISVTAQGNCQPTVVGISDQPGSLTTVNEHIPVSAHWDPLRHQLLLWNRSNQPVSVAIIDLWGRQIGRQVLNPHASRWLPMTTMPVGIQVHTPAASHFYRVQIQSR